MTGVIKKEKGAWTQTGPQGEHRVKMSEGGGQGDAPPSQGGQGPPASPQKFGKRAGVVSPSQPLERVSPGWGGGPSLQSSGLQN